jgi:hypothetical protein
MGIGLYTAALGNRKWEHLLLVGGLYPLLILPVFHIQTRYLYPLLPIFLIWAGQGAAVVMNTLRQVRSPILGPRGAQVLAVLGLVLVAGYQYNTLRDHPFQVSRDEKRVGRWLKETYGPGRRVMDSQGIVAYHAGATPIDVPFASIDRVLAWGKREGAEFLVVGTALLHPDVDDLLETGAPPGLRLVREFNPAPAAQTKRRFVVYQLM